MPNGEHVREAMTTSAAVLEALLIALVAGPTISNVEIPVQQFSYGAHS